MMRTDSPTDTDIRVTEQFLHRPDVVTIAPFSPKVSMVAIAALERFRVSCSNAVAAMLDVVGALVWHEERDRGRHQCARHAIVITCSTPS